MSDDIRKIIVTADPVIFRIGQSEIEFLVIKRQEDPFAGLYTLPGAMVDPECDNDLREPMLRKLLSKTGIFNGSLHLSSQISLMQVETIGNPYRDPRGWSVTTVYMGLIPADSNLDLGENATWLPMSDLVKIKLGFDHNELVRIAFSRLSKQARYSTLPLGLMPEYFTMNMARKAYEMITGDAMDPKSFRRRMEATDLMIKVGMTQGEGKGRPAELYMLQHLGSMFYFERNA